MSKMMENVKTANSVVRTAIMVAVLGIVGYGGWFTYAHLIKPRIQAQLDLEEANRELEKVREQNEEQKEQITILTLQNEKLETANRLLKVDHRLAHVKILESGNDEKTGKPFTLVSFQEVGTDGEKIGTAKEFRLNGREVRIDSWVVKFKNEYIEQADLHRGTSLVMFKKIYGELDIPVEGHSLEEQWSRPEAYARGSKLSDFEKTIWDNFWKFANRSYEGSEKGQQDEYGLRAAHGAVIYLQPEVGKVYEVNLRASDGLTFRPIEEKDESDSDSNDTT